MNSNERARCAAKARHLLFYVPIVAVLLGGYAGGGYLAFGVPFAQAVSSITDPTGRTVLRLYGMGMLGASLYCSRWWSLDLDNVAEGKSSPPNGFDAFGYLFTIVGGGITGVVFYVVTGTGMDLVSAGAQAPIRLGAGSVIALVGGLFHFRVQEILKDLFDRMAQKEARKAEEARQIEEKAGEAREGEAGTKPKAA